MKVVRRIIVVGLMIIIAVWSITGTVQGVQTGITNKMTKVLPINEETLASRPDQLIRFHVLANSDSEQDQALKRAVRDAILKEVSPKLAVSQSLAESRKVLQKLRPKMEEIARLVVKTWGKDYSVHTEYGHFSFPTKSYGSLVLPSGNYEALRVVIGEGQGSNWWCVLFPPLCFIDIEHSTAVQVDGKPGIPINNEPQIQTNKQVSSLAGLPKVRCYFWELIIRLLS